jgi:hypothetical protein
VKGEWKGVIRQSRSVLIVPFEIDVLAGVDGDRDSVSSAAAFVTASADLHQSRAITFVDVQVGVDAGLARVDDHGGDKLDVLIHIPVGSRRIRKNGGAVMKGTAYTAGFIRRNDNLQIISVC